MVTVPEGNMLIDYGYGIGVFDSSRKLNTGLNIYSDTVLFTPDGSGLNNVYFHDLGFGVRATPDQLMVIKDAEVSMLLEKSETDGASSLIFSRNMLPKWSVKSDSDSGNTVLYFTNAANTEVLKMTNGEIRINSPSSPSKKVSVNGNLAFVDAAMQLMPQNNADVPNNAINFTDIDNNDLIISPIIDAAGLELHTSAGQQVKFQYESLSFGQDNVPSSPTNSLYVRDGVFISNRLMLNDEKIEYKTIRTPAKKFIHNKQNEVQQLSFDFDSGFDISTPSDNTVILTYLEHFSRMSAVSANIVITPNTQIITPNGIDMMSFLGDNISIQASNVDAEGNPNGAMDSLTFFNDLMNGGTINGDLLISATLNVIGSDSNGVVHGLEGNISEMYNIPFPWHHTVTENGALVNYEFVITENVGIGLTQPLYPLQVAGISSINIVQSPSINVQKEFVSNKDYLNVIVAGNELNVTLNTSETINDSLIQFSGATIKDNHFGLNGINDNYTMALYPKSEGVDSDVYLEGKTSAKLSIYDQFDLKTDSTGDLIFNVIGPGNDFILMNKKTSMYVENQNRLGIGILKKPKNSLDVSGNMVIGSALAGKITAPKNSLMVQGKMGIGTNQPDAFTDVQGSVVVAESPAYLGSITGLNNDFVVQTKLFVDEYDASSLDSMLVNGHMTGIGNLYFNKSTNPDNSELSFFNDASNDRFVIGYGSSKSDRSLAIRGKSYIDLTPKPNVKGIYIDAAGRLALGHKSPEALLHVKKNNIKFKIEASGNGDSTIQFESGKNGLMGISSSVASQFILSDGENPQIAGADLSIDSAGNLDIGFNLANASTVQPTHSVRVDIFGKLNATHVVENGQVLTHMPEGSIIMWSGYKSELPDGWELCDGTTSCPENLVDRFVIGKSTGEKLGGEIGSHSFSIATSSDYSHKHKSTHSHAGLTATSHSHSNVNLPNKNGSNHTSSDDSPSGTSSVGEEGYTEYWEECSDWGWGWSCEDRSKWHDYGKTGGYSGPSTRNGNHRHGVTINHGHTASTGSNSHNHTLASKVHEHSNTVHDHLVENEPVYYQLAFIYLKGEG